MQKLKNMCVGLIELCATLIIGGLMIIAGIILGLDLASLIIKLFSGLIKPNVPNFNVINSFLRINSGTQVVMLLAVLIIVGGIVVTYRLTRTILNSLEEDIPAFHKQKWLEIIALAAGLALVGGGYFILNLPVQSLFNPLLPAFVTIVAGTYLICYSLLSLLPATWFNKIKLTKGKTLLGLHHYAGVFTIISLLFALTMGALG